MKKFFTRISRWFTRLITGIKLFINARFIDFFWLIGSLVGLIWKASQLAWAAFTEAFKESSEIQVDK